MRASAHFHPSQVLVHPSDAFGAVVLPPRAPLQILSPWDENYPPLQDEPPCVWTFTNDAQQLRRDAPAGRQAHRRSASDLRIDNLQTDIQAQHPGFNICTQRTACRARML